MSSMVMIYIVQVLLLVILWFPGFLLGRNMTIAMAERNPTASEILLSAIPGINVGVARKQIYGSAKLVWIPLIACFVLGVLKFGFYFFIHNQAGVMLSLIFTILFVASIIVLWFIQGIVLWDMCNVLNKGMLNKIMCFVIPPLGMYFVARDCVPLTRSMMAEYNEE